ncbi:MAG: sugar transferase [Clostridia bacterium]|nr:sugar transferase [Clostridia bacterium]
MKRFLDFVFSFLLIIILSPVMLVIAVAILIFDGKPVIFYQKRVGYKNECFYIYKFRTMKNGTKEKATALLKDIDSQVTGIGKVLRRLSLDELPQLFNVLKGDMSFVGPRPLIPKEKKIRNLREQYNVFSVKPGITGLAQINGRDNITDERKALYDKEYVENHNLWMDFTILLRTFINVTKSKDVNDSCGDYVKEAEDLENNIRVMSFNILCRGDGEHSREKRAPYVVDLIKREAPDVIGFQEATPEWMAYLKSSLKNYNAIGVGRDDGANKGEFSAIFYSRNRFLLRNSGNFWLSETPDEASLGWDGKHNRICTWAILKDLYTTRKFVILNTHTDHVGEVAVNEGVKLIVKKVRGLNNMPTFVTGDFNLKEGSRDYNIIVNSGVLRDSKYVCEDIVNINTYNGLGVGEQCVVDYIFVNKSLNPVKYNVVTDKNGDYYISDHYPVVVDCKFK